MAGSDRLSELLVPSVIDRFDAIPGDHMLLLHVAKGEVALAIKSAYQLHNAVAGVLNIISDFTFTDDGKAKLAQAFSQLNSASSSMAAATNPLIDRIVSDVSGSE